MTRVIAAAFMSTESRACLTSSTPGPDRGLREGVGVLGQLHQAVHVVDLDGLAPLDPQASLSQGPHQHVRVVNV